MTQAVRTSPALPDVPPLENGDQLSREEFERRWELHPEIKKAELIDGMVFLEVTVSRRHGKPHVVVTTWAGVYAARTPSCEALADTTVRLRGRDDLQPDVLLRKVEGGSSVVSVDDCIEGPPELAIEIAASSASYDLHVKKEAYRRAGVQEYLVWQVFERRIDWWTLADGTYQPLPLSDEGIFESRVFPGLKLAALKMLEGDLEAVLAAAQASE